MREIDEDASPPALVLRNLRKTFARPAVDGLDLTVRAGELYALLGRTSAGKTTTLRMVAGLLLADSGAIGVFGVDAIRRPIEAMPIIAVTTDEPMLYDKLDPARMISNLWPASGASRGGGARKARQRTPGDVAGLWELSMRALRGLFARR